MTEQVFETMSCKCEFTQEELHEKVEELAKKIDEKESIEDHKKEIVAQLNADIKAIDNRVKVLGTHLRNKYEFRMIKCEVFRDYERNKVVYTRTDTGEIVRTKNMTQADRQTALGLGE